MAEDTRGPHFGQVAQELGYVAGYQVLEALDRQRSFSRTGRGTRPIGEHFTQLGHLTEQQVTEVLGELERRRNAPAPTAKEPGKAAPSPKPRRFGEIALDLGFVTKRDVEYALELQQVTRSCGREVRPIGLLLVGMGTLSLDQVDVVLQALTTERNRMEVANAETAAIAVAAKRE